MRILALVLALVCLPVLAQEERGLTPSGCSVYAVWVRDILLMKDVGADKEKLRQKLKYYAAHGYAANAESVGERYLFQVLDYQLDKLWDGDSKVRGLELSEIARQACFAARGQFPVNKGVEG